MQKLEEKRNLQKVFGKRKRNHKLSFSFEVSERRHLRDSYIKEMKEEYKKVKIQENYSNIINLLKKEDHSQNVKVDKTSDYEINLIKNRYRNLKGITSTTSPMAIIETPGNEKIDQDKQKVYQIKDIRSRLTKKENKYIKGRLDQLINSSSNKKNLNLESEIPLLTNSQFDAIQHRINYSKDNMKNLPLKERSWQIISLNEEWSFFSILSKDKLCPLKLKFINIPSKSINLYLSTSSKHPNSKNFQERCQYIQPGVTYSFNFGEEELKKFKFEFIYISMISKFSCKFKMIYSFDSEGLFPKIDKFTKFDGSIDSNINIGKTSIDNLLITQNVFDVIFENEQLIKERKKKMLMMNSDQEDIVKRNMNVMNSFYSFIVGRNSKVNLDKKRSQIAKKRRTQMLESKLLYNTLLLHRWKLRKKQVI